MREPESKVAPEAIGVSASSVCPLCGVDKPHAHTRHELIHRFREEALRKEFETWLPSWYAHYREVLPGSYGMGPMLTRRAVTLPDSYAWWPVEMLWWQFLHGATFAAAPIDDNDSVPQMHEALAIKADPFGKMVARELLAARERIASLTAQVATLESDAQQYKRKLAVLFDESTYSDSYGVEGSSFGVCRWCGGGSGPGGSAPFKHNAGCLFDDDALEAKVRDVWDEDTAIECLSLEKRIATLEKAQEIRAASIRRLEQQVATLESEKAAAREAGFAEAREAAARIAAVYDSQIGTAIRSLSAPTKEQPK